MWKLPNQQVPQSEKFQIKWFCWTKLKENVAGLRILITFLTVFCWEAVVTSCVATRTWHLAHLTAEFFCLTCENSFKNTTQSTSFWKISVHKHSRVLAAQLQQGHWSTRCPFQWLELALSRYLPICLMLLPYLRCHRWLSECSNSVSVQM